MCCGKPGRIARLLDVWKAARWRSGARWSVKAGRVVDDMHRRLDAARACRSSIGRSAAAAGIVGGQWICDSCAW